MKKYKRVIAITLSFLLFIFLSVSVFLYIFDFTFYNKDNIMTNIEKSNYPQNLYEEINEKISSYTLVNGFGRDFYKKSDIQSVITKSIYDNLLFNNEIINNKKELEEITKKTASSEIFYNENEQVFNNLITKVDEIIKDNTTLPFYGVVKKIHNMGYNLKMVNLATSCLCVILIGLIAIVYKKRAFSFIEYSLFSSSIVILIPSIYLIVTQKIMNIGILTKALYTLITHTLNNMNSMLLAGGCILFVVFILLDIIRRKVKKGIL